MKPYLPKLRSLLGDNTQILPELPPNSIHLVVTKPPHPEDFPSQENFQKVACEIHRVLKPHGILCWNVCDEAPQSPKIFEHILFLQKQIGLTRFETLILEKTPNPKREKQRYQQSFEYIFIFAKGSPKTFNPIKDQLTTGNPPTPQENSLGLLPEEEPTPTRRKRPKLFHRTNIWRGKSRQEEEERKNLPHPAMMPKWLAKDLIYSFSRPKDTVLDPYAGTGTIGEQALNLGRNAILIEHQAHYQQLHQKPLQAGFAFPT